jgi:hypothetical protein
MGCLSGFGLRFFFDFSASATRCIVPMTLFGFREIQNQLGEIVAADGEAVEAR